jgi:hypothetical protein
MASYYVRMSELSPGLAGLLHTYGEQWQIERDHEANVWTAVNRPTPTALHVLVAHDLPGLAAKLESAQDGLHS